MRVRRMGYLGVRTDRVPEMTAFFLGAPNGASTRIEEAPELAAP